MITRLRNRLGAERTDDGYSLIELLVVLLIIGILAAIALPRLLSARGAANDGVAKDTLRKAVSAITPYEAKTGDFAILWDSVNSAVLLTKLSNAEPNINFISGAATVNTGADSRKMVSVGLGGCVAGGYNNGLASGNCSPATQTNKVLTYTAPGDGTTCWGIRLHEDTAYSSGSSGAVIPRQVEYFVYTSNTVGSCTASALTFNLPTGWATTTNFNVQNGDFPSAP